MRIKNRRYDHHRVCLCNKQTTKWLPEKHVIFISTRPETTSLPFLFQKFPEKWNGKITRSILSRPNLSLFDDRVKFLIYRDQDQGSVK